MATVRGMWKAQSCTRKSSLGLYDSIHHGCFETRTLYFLALLTTYFRSLLLESLTEHYGESEACTLHHLW
jgi:hypothetical protein